MKKIIIFLTLIILTGVLTGCKQSKTISCTLSDKTVAYELSNHYKIHSEDGIVKKVEITENITATDEALLSELEKSEKNQYESNKKSYGGYTYEVKKEDSKVVTNVTIDYSKVDLSKMVADNTNLKPYANDKNELKAEGLVKWYESIGAKCKK